MSCVYAVQVTNTPRQAALIQLPARQPMNKSRNGIK